MRLGICYPRDTSICGAPFGLPGAGEVFAWSRVLAYQEVVVAMNTHGLEARGAEVTVDAALHGSDGLRELYRADWSDERLRAINGQGEWVRINRQPDGRATVRVDLPPAGMVILA
jgi:hypothetical protein